MALIHVVLLIAVALPCGWTYAPSAGAQLLETNLLDSLGGLDVGDESPGATQRKADPEADAILSKPPERGSSTAIEVDGVPGSGGEEPSELPKLKFPYIDPLEDGATNTSVGNNTSVIEVAELEQQRRIHQAKDGPEIDFNKELLASLKIAKHKPPCETTAWSAWSACKGSCKRNQMGQTGAAVQTRTRSLLAPGEASTQGTSMLSLKWKGRITKAKHLMEEALKDSKAVTNHAQARIVELKARKKNIDDVQEKVEIDAQIFKVESQAQKADARVKEAEQRVEQVQRMADEAHDRAVASATQSDVALAQALNRPPYCEPPRLSEEKVCVSKIFCPIDCVVSQWEPWPTCKAQHCNLGLGQIRATRHRSRSVVQDPMYGGKKCPFTVEQQPCTDTSCIWKVSEESGFKLQRCNNLLKSEEFSQWSQLWIHQRDLDQLKPIFQALSQKFKQQSQVLAEFDAFQTHLMTMISQQCKIFKHLDRVLKLPREKLDVQTICLDGMKKVCNSAHWAIQDHCHKISIKACSATNENLSDRVDEVFQLAADRDQRLAQAAGQRLWRDCVKISGFSKMLSEALFGVADIRQAHTTLKIKVAEYERKVLYLEDQLQSYSQIYLNDGRDGDWACTRINGPNIREQSFECTKQDTGVPYESILCKGKQVGRILQDKSSGACPESSMNTPVIRRPGEKDWGLEKRQNLADTQWGCACPKGESKRDLICCRPGEESVIDQVTGSRTEVRCQCPDGQEFIEVRSNVHAWRDSQCRLNEHQTDEHHCDKSSLFRSSTSVCCVSVSHQCQPKCDDHELRLRDGNCVAAAKFGCFIFDQKAYQNKQDVKCLLPVSEAAFTKDDCLKFAGAVWRPAVTSSNSSSSMLSPKASTNVNHQFCFRPQSSWTTLFQKCSVDLNENAMNTMNCDTFGAESFLHHVPHQDSVSVDYFSFVSETVLYQGGLPADQDGLRMPSPFINDEELPHSYAVYNPSEDLDIEDKADAMEKGGKLPPVDYSASRRLFSTPYHPSPFIDASSTFSMSTFGAPLDGEPDDKSLGTSLQGNPQSGADNSEVEDMAEFLNFQRDETLAKPEGRRLLAEDSIDPIDFGSSAAYRKRMNDIKDATNDFNKAMGGKMPVEAKPPKGSQAGKQSKVCVPPPHIAGCLVELGRGVRMSRQSQTCMTNSDMAWFRNQCAQL